MKIFGYPLVKEILDTIIEKKELPNLIFNGKTGCGKNYLINYLLDKLYGTHKDERVLYLSICDERGISVIREKIKYFANLQVSSLDGLPSYKVIVFDHAEYISSDAQNALRRIIEMTNNLTRFIFITKNPRVLIEPIVSRCLLLNLNFHEDDEKIKDYKETYKNLDDEMINYIVNNSHHNFDEEKNKLNEWDKNKTDREILEKLKENMFYIKKNLGKNKVENIVNLMNEIKKKTNFNLFELSKNFYKFLINDNKLEKQIFEINDEYYKFNKIVSKGGDINLNFINFYLNISKLI